MTESVPPLDRPLLIYDGDCGFCRLWIARWRHITGDRVAYAPYQEVADRFPQIPRERFAAAVQLVEPDGRISQTAEAVFRSLAYAPGRGWMLWLYARVPPLAAVSEWFYRFVAAHRSGFLRLTRALWGQHLVPPGEALTAWIFLRLLGLVYAIAFLSLGVQILGLVGSDGILPAHDFLKAVGQNYGIERFWLAPTLCWFGAGDGVLRGLCVAGTALSVLLIAGFASVPALVGLWVLYLSLATVAQNFLWFQWDSLLLEAGFLALLLAWRRWWSRPSTDPQPWRPALWLMRWLLFRLMFSSAVVKLTSGDPTWRNLTALTYHYETQPLPPWTAWYMHQLPAWFHALSAGLMFVVEGLVPFLIFAPRRLRALGAWIMIGFQMLIAATGNYGFFNWLTIALCVLLFDDAMWPRFLRERVRRPAFSPAAGRRGGPALVMTAAVLFTLSMVPLFRALRWGEEKLGPVRALYLAVSPLRVVNSYGLFMVMTTRRPEIILEGSNDGTTWQAYEFPFKPGALDRRPPFVAPYQPRLDWQMWFAALRDYRSETWFLHFCQRLLEGSPPVLRLLAKNPFPEAPPRYLRAVLFQYWFTDAATRRATGDWWRRERLGLYCPVLALEGGRLIAAPGAEQ